MDAGASVVGRLIDGGVGLPVWGGRVCVFFGVVLYVLSLYSYHIWLRP